MNSGIRRILSRSACGLMLAAMLAACGSASDEVEPTVTRVAVGYTPAASPVTEATPESASPVASPNGGNAPAATAVEVEMLDTLAFEPPQLTIAADTDVTITAINVGVLPHTFTIPDVADTGEVAGGESAEVVVNLPPGEYEFLCAVPGHADGGMVGTLVVEAAGGGAGEAALPADTEGGEGDSGGEVAGATMVDLNMVDLAFEPKDFTIPANTDVTVNLTNSGALPHAFQLEDGSVESDELPSGESATLTLNLAPGTYPYICPVPGHADSGMVGTITVE